MLSARRESPVELRRVWSRSRTRLSFPRRSVSAFFSARIRSASAPDATSPSATWDRRCTSPASAPPGGSSARSPHVVQMPSMRNGCPQPPASPAGAAALRSWDPSAGPLSAPVLRPGPAGGGADSDRVPRRARGGKRPSPAPLGVDRGAKRPPRQQNLQVAASAGHAGRGKALTTPPPRTPRAPLTPPRTPHPRRPTWRTRRDLPPRGVRGEGGAAGAAGTSGRCLGVCPTRRATDLLPGTGVASPRELGRAGRPRGPIGRRGSRFRPCFQSPPRRARRHGPRQPSPTRGGVAGAAPGGRGGQCSGGAVRRGGIKDLPPGIGGCRDFSFPAPASSRRLGPPRCLRPPRPPLPPPGGRGAYSGARGSHHGLAASLATRVTTSMSAWTPTAGS